MQKDVVIYKQAAIDALGEEPYVWTDSDSELAEREQWRRDVDAIKSLPSAQSKKFSEVLQDMMDEDYYLFCHTGYSRLAEKDWEWLIEQVKEIEQNEKEN